MATWHQERGGNLAGLYKPVPGQWKCVSNKPNQLACSIAFDNEADAKRYCERTGDTLVAPPKEAP